MQAGIFTEKEFAGLESGDQVALEAEAQRLFDQYGAEWLSRERGRLRDELSFMAGLP